MGKFKQFLSESSLDQLKSNWKKQGLDISLSEDKTTLSLGKISVPKEKRNQGIGSNFMKELIQYADKTNKKIVLSPSTDFGGSSVSRLKDFYKSFGFVENKGRNKDFTISYSMYREPKILKEDPDRVDTHTWWGQQEARTFGYVNNKFFISKNTTNHPDFALHLLNTKQITINDLPIDSQKSREVDRNVFKYAGRLWGQKHILSFWSYPSKNDFDKLVQDIKKNGIHVDDTWMVDESGSTLFGPSKLVPITNYSNKFKDIKVKQVDHVVSPMLKTKNKSIVPGNVIKVGRKLPKGVSMAKYNFLTKNEGLDESKIPGIEIKIFNVSEDSWVSFVLLKNANSSLYKTLDSHFLKQFKIIPENVIANATMIEQSNGKVRVSGIVVDVKYRRNGIATHIYDEFEKKIHKKIIPSGYQSLDAKEFWKNRNKVNEDVPTTIAPSSVETGQHANKLGSVGKRKEPSLINNIKDKVKKKLKQKSKKEE